MYISIPLEEVQALLRSAELADIQGAVLTAIGSRVVHEELATPRQRELSNAGIAVSTIYDLFREERELLVRFALLCQKAPEDPAELDGEYAPGEEQEPSIRVGEPLGHQNGFMVYHANCLILARRGKDDLLRWLKWHRIPFAAKYCRELLTYLKIASQQ